jgi:hypothetical protein
MIRSHITVVLIPGIILTDSRQICIPKLLIQNILHYNARQMNNARLARLFTIKEII